MVGRSQIRWKWKNLSSGVEVVVAQIDLCVFGNMVLAEPFSALLAAVSSSLSVFFCHSAPSLSLLAFPE